MCDALTLFTRMFKNALPFGIQKIFWIHYFGLYIYIYIYIYIALYFTIYTVYHFSWSKENVSGSLRALFYQTASAINDILVTFLTDYRFCWWFHGKKNRKILTLFCNFWSNNIVTKYCQNIIKLFQEFLLVDEYTIVILRNI